MNGPVDKEVGESTQHRRRVATASFIGTVVEWYDFILYGTAAAVVLNRLFFPGDDPVLSTLATFATYAVGFLARPLGGLVLGNLGDRVGRRAMLVITLILMGSGTTLIGLLPTYQSIGAWAPVLLVGLRLVQGFGAGGEYAGAVVFSVESASPRRRGIAGTAAPLGFAAGTLLANGVFNLFVFLPREQFDAWGWRVPFLLSALTVVVGFVIRMKVSEPKVFEEQKKHRDIEKPGLFASLMHHPRSFVTVVFTRMGENVFAYLVPVFGVSYITQQVGLSERWALGAVMLASIVQLIVIPLFGWASDFVGRRPIYLFGIILSVVWMVPYFMLVDTGNLGLMIAGVVVGFGLFYPAMLAPQAAWYAELFDTEFRTSGFAFAREIGSLLSGGIAPFIATWLFSLTGHWWPIAIYLGLVGILTVIGLCLGRETLHRDLLSRMDSRNDQVDGSSVNPER